MGDLVKAFHKFLMRDLSYIFGGGAVILSFFYFFNLFPKETPSTYWYVLGVAFAYVVGYAIQDALGVLHIIRMKAGHPPNRHGRWLYKLYDCETPEPFVKAKYDRGKDWLYTSAAQRYKDDHERIEGLKQVGFAIGSCLIISGTPFLIRYLIRYFFTSGACDLDLFLSLALLPIGVVLYLLGWLKVTQQTQYVLRFSSKYRSRTFRQGRKRGRKVRRGKR